MSDLKFCVSPGYVQSKTDGQTHYVGVAQLVRLYGVAPGTYVVHNKDYPPVDCCTLTHCSPRYDGKYPAFGDL